MLWFGSLSFLGFCSGALEIVAAKLFLELFHSARSVHELLLAGIERMAVRANLDLDFRLGRSRLKRVPATAGHFCVHVFGVDVFFHAFTGPKGHSIISLAIIADLYRLARPGEG